MLSQLLENIAGVILGAISAGGYLGIAALMAIESACIPLPSELIMPFAGYLVSTGRLSLVGVAIAGAVGCNIGSTIAYALGALVGRPAIVRWGRFVLLDKDDIETAERFFIRFGPLAVFVGRLLPVVRTFVALPAGFAHMPVWRFQIYTFVGSLIWCFLLAWIGQWLGTQWDTSQWLQTVFRTSDAIVVAVAVTALTFFVWRRVHSKS